MIERQRPRLRKPRRSARPCARRRHTRRTPRRRRTRRSRAGRRTRRGRRRTRRSRAGGVEHDARSVRALLPGLPGGPRRVHHSPERLVNGVPLVLAVRCNYALGNYRVGPVSKALEDQLASHMSSKDGTTVRCTESHCAMQR